MGQRDPANFGPQVPTRLAAVVASAPETGLGPAILAARFLLSLVPVAAPSTSRTRRGTRRHGYGLFPAALLLGCASEPVASGQAPDAGVVPGYTMLLGDYLLTPTRKLDLAFIIDDSPSMVPKRDKLAVQLPKLLAAFRDPNDGTLPSLRVAILDGDLGSGGAITEGACGPKNGSILGDEGAAQIIGGPDCGMTDPGAHWIQSLTLSPANFSGDIIQVFACLAGGLGQSGCGYQQPLQALAISATDLGPASLPKFLRDNAYLGIIIISVRTTARRYPT